MRWLAAIGRPGSAADIGDNRDNKRRYHHDECEDKHERADDAAVCSLLEGMRRHLKPPVLILSTYAPGCGRFRAESERLIMCGFCNLTVTFRLGSVSGRQDDPMIKNLPTKAVAAALAASMALAFAAPALAQPGYRDDGRLEGSPPPLFGGQDRRDDRGWNDRDDWRRRKPDFQSVQRDCSIAGIREAWDRNFYSAQYHEGPKLYEGRYGWEMRGKMRLHDRKGYAYVDTTCDVGRGGDVRIEFGRQKR